MVRNERAIQKSGLSSAESRYYISSAQPGEHIPAQWLELIRSHWTGVENRNPWRRDALRGEDGSRSRLAGLLANPPLIRNALLKVLSDPLEQQSLPQWRERLHSSPARCLALLARS